MNDAHEKFLNDSMTPVMRNYKSELHKKLDDVFSEMWKIIESHEDTMPGVYCEQCKEEIDCDMVTDEAGVWQVWIGPHECKNANRDTS